MGEIREEKNERDYDDEKGRERKEEAKDKKIETSSNLYGYVRAFANYEDDSIDRERLKD